MQISILVATQSGTATRVANAVRHALGAEGHTVDVLPMDDLDADVFRRDGAFLICTSTYGAGDVPINARFFLTDLRLERPNLDGTLIGIIGLGDSTFGSTFNNGGARFEDMLECLNAHIVGDRLRHDASSDIGAEEAGVAWARAWIAEVLDLVGADDIASLTDR